MNVTRPARSCRLRRTTQNAGVLALDATVALGSRPAPDVIQPAWPHQAASSRATLAGGAARAAKLGIFTVAPPAQSTDICDQARGRPSLRRNSRPSRGSAALAFPTSGVSTERVRGQHAWSKMHGRLRRRCRAEEDRCSRSPCAGERRTLCLVLYTHTDSTVRCYHLALLHG